VHASVHQIKGLPEEKQGKPYGFWLGRGMGYGRFMGYVMHFPVNQLGGHKMLWGLRGYGFSEVWVKRGSTVHCIDWWLAFFIVSSGTQVQGSSDSQITQVMMIISLIRNGNHEASSFFKCICFINKLYK